MLIGIVAASNIRYSPYIFYYTNILDSYGFEYELIYADQENVEDEFNRISFSYKWNNKVPRAIEYYFYSRKAISIIKKRKYDGLIMLTSITATYCSLFLKKYYKKGYIVDIRDFSHENIKPYYWLEKISILNSAMTIISSPKFKTFLPNFEYDVCHNINFEVNNNENKKWEKPNSDRIRIGYVGSVAYKKNCLKLINLVNNDTRFEFDIYGYEPDKSIVQDYIKLLHNDRIRYNGPYKPIEKESIINSVDILFNTYGNGCLLLDYALSNKLYDALYYKKLLLVSPNTAMEEIGGLIAYSFNYDNEKNLDNLYEWILKLKKDDVQIYQDLTFNRFLEENNKTQRKVIETIKSWVKYKEKNK